MMDLSAATGAYIGKASMSKIVKKFALPLVMTAIVHERGTIKYVSYSWQNNPECSNSTVSDNLDAIERHLGAHSMGKLMDGEGLPHLFHIACRASMLITTHIRSRMMNDPKKHPFYPRMLRQKDTLGTFAETLAGTQLTSEELLACSKHLPDIYHDNMSINEIYAAIRGHLFDCNLYVVHENLPKLNKDLGYPDISGDVFKDVDALEGLFQLLYRYVDLIWNRDIDTYIELLEEMHKRQPYRDVDLQNFNKYLHIELVK